jgi:serpin B
MYHSKYKNEHNNLLFLGKKQNSDISISNALIVDKSHIIEEKYQEKLKKLYMGKFYSFDLKNDKNNSCKQINQWIAAKTHLKIKNMLTQDSIPSSVALYILNAIYFKAGWLSKFQDYHTIKNTFYCLDNQKVQVPTMFQKNSFYYAENSDMQFLGMRYKGGTFSMGILLPRKTKDFKTFEKELKIATLQDICTAAKPESIRVFLPKFKAKSQFFLKKTLNELGIINAFERGKADFKKISPSIYVNRILQRAEIEVNEKGTTAVTATFSEFDYFGDPPPQPKPKTFRANRPFIFFIQETKTKTILFMGRMLKPM